MEGKRILIGPFTQLLTFADTPLRGALSNKQIGILEHAGIVLSDGKILEVGSFEDLLNQNKGNVLRVDGSFVAMPGMIDSHTHLCFEGSRHHDYSDRNQGISYLEIAKRGGGIWDTVQKTRSASSKDLEIGTGERLAKCIRDGITTVEIKTGYGLSVEEEMRMLRCIATVSEVGSPDIISTCLAAHMKPKDFVGSNSDYLEMLIKELLPKIKSEGLSNRIDIFVEEGAFLVDESRGYLEQAQSMGFDLCIHGDQFSTGGSMLAVEVGAASVDHLEVSGQGEIQALAKSETVATVLPGASLGLGIGFAPARRLLDAGACLAIASDWNPGSAPMGDLLTQASILGAYEKLSDAEVLGGLTFRAAKALNLEDRGRLVKGDMADICAFPAVDFREILYHQGQLKPAFVWKSGKQMV